MNDKELLAKAISFDGGQFVTNNGWICNPEFDLGLIDHYEITFGGKGWTIRIGRTCLSKKTDEFEFESFPSERTDEYFLDTRFDTIQEAFAFLDEWKKRELQRAINAGMLVWHPDMNKRKLYGINKGTLGSE